MISLGSTEIKGLRLGSSKIKKAYLGNEIVWTRELVIYTTSTYEKERGDDRIKFDWDAPGYNSINEQFIKYIIIDGKYRTYKGDVSVYMDNINFTSAKNPLINMAFPKGTRIKMVFEVE